jgi:hypothetical protein
MERHCLKHYRRNCIGVPIKGLEYVAVCSAFIIFICMIPHLFAKISMMAGQQN